MCRNSVNSASVESLFNVAAVVYLREVISAIGSFHVARIR